MYQTPGDRRAFLEQSPHPSRFGVLEELAFLGALRARYPKLDGAQAIALLEPATLSGIRVLETLEEGVSIDRAPDAALSAESRPEG